MPEPMSYAQEKRRYAELRSIATQHAKNRGEECPCDLCTAIRFIANTKEDLADRTKDHTDLMDQHANSIEEIRRLTEENQRLSDSLKRFTFPWTVQIKNNRTGLWESFCHDAPITLAEAEKREVELNAEFKGNTPPPSFRIMPWLNCEQLRYLDAEMSILRAGVEAVEEFTNHQIKTAMRSAMESVREKK